MFRCPSQTLPASARAVVVALLGLLLFVSGGIAETTASPRPNNPEQRAKDNYNACRTRFDLAPENVESAWQFARAAFDWAEFAKNNRQREEIALQGIAAARRAVVLAPDSVPARYYLGMNLGQLARTKSIGALKLVAEMEREFKKARELDELFDHAGPDRNLGLLYLEAPSFSIGDKKKARVHLLKAVELAPNYPENRLNLIEAYLKWGEKKSAEIALRELDALWPKALKALEGEEWETSWADWTSRRTKARERLR